MKVKVIERQAFANGWVRLVDMGRLFDQDRFRIQYWLDQQYGESHHASKQEALAAMADLIRSNVCDNF